MNFDKKLLDHLKQQLGFESDARLGRWSGINKNSISGIRNDRLVMGESIRFALLSKWWTHLRLKPEAVPKTDAITSDTGMSEEPAELSAQALLEMVRRRLDPPSASHLIAMGVNTPPDALLLEAYKIYRGSETNSELANLLGIKQNSVSMVRTGHNKLGPLPLLKIFEDVCNAQHLGLHRAVQSSEALLALFTGKCDQLMSNEKTTPAAQPQINPQLAKTIAENLLVYHNFNRLRALVDDLRKLGVDAKSFAAFVELAKESNVGIPYYLLVEVQNMLLHLDKGIEMPSDCLNSASHRSIQKRVADFEKFYN